MSKTITKSIEIGGRTLTLETGFFAPQAGASVLGRYGDTMVLTTVCRGPKREDLDYFPLTVDYVERLYAGGKISTSRFIKRERLPSEEAILTGRLVDRSIRPLFPKDFFDEVQVIITVLSVDAENDPDVLSIITTSAALSLSDIPWNGPLGALRVGFRDNAFFTNPLNGELEFSELDLVVSTTKEAIVMVEAGAKEAEEKIVLGALEFALKEVQPVISLIEELTAIVGQKKAVGEKEKREEKLEKEARDYIRDNFLPQLKAPEVLSDETWDRRCLLELEEFFAEKEITKQALARIFEEEFRHFVRTKILKENKRLDGRLPTEIRPVSSTVGILPRTHGSAIFTRGKTQILTVVTLGSPRLEQLIEGMMGAETKRYMHHYNFPPFSTGETKRLGPPARREIGHGALAERALLPVSPPEEKFPYTIRVVSEVLSSAGSTSMGAVCGSTLALMDAGVPISAPVAGLAIGLITQDKDYKILSDIAYAEDASGDMDLKVAGTQKGITAVQMDLKITGITSEILGKALEQAREGRLFILKEMLAVLPAPRSQISPHAPQVVVLRVEPAQIGDIIGGGGKTIRKIIAETQTAVDVEDDGSVTITGTNPEQIEKAVKWIEGLTKEVQPGEVFEGEVKRILPFGAFVEIVPGKEGLVHVSQMASGFVKRPEDVVQIGQKVKVRVTEIDDQGRVNLSMLFGEEAQKEGPPRHPQQRPYHPGFRPHLGRGDQGGRGGGSGGGLRDRFRRPRY